MNTLWGPLVNTRLGVTTWLFKLGNWQFTQCVSKCTVLDIMSSPTFYHGPWGPRAGCFRHRIKIEYIGNLWRGSRGFLITSDGFLHLDSIYIPNNMHNASKVPRLLAFSSIRIIKTFSHYWITSTIQCHLKQSRREIRNWLDSSFCLLSIVIKILSSLTLLSVPQANKMSVWDEVILILCILTVSKFCAQPDIKAILHSY